LLCIGATEFLSLQSVYSGIAFVVVLAFFVSACGQSNFSFIDLSSHALKYIFSFLNEKLAVEDDVARILFVC